MYTVRRPLLGRDGVDKNVAIQVHAVRLGDDGQFILTRSVNQLQLVLLTRYTQRLREC